jgi:hypothetical protein
MASTKKIKIMSPRGIAVYPRLNRPDTKFNEHGTYSCDIRLPMDETTKAFLGVIGDHYKAHTGTAHPKKPARKDKEAIFFFDENEEGDKVMDFVTIKLRAKNVLVKKGENAGKVWDRKPRTFDASGQPLPGSVKVGGGSTVKVAFEVDNGETSAGIKFTRLIPTAVQIIDLVEFGNETASSFGFDEEDGYEAPEATTSTEPKTNDSSEKGDDTSTEEGADFY